MRTRVALALLYASLALVGAGAWTPPVLASAAGAPPAAHLAPADAAPGDVRQSQADPAGTAPGVQPSPAALLWTAPDRLLPAALDAGDLARAALHPRTPLACRGARAPPARTRS